MNIVAPRFAIVGGREERCGLDKLICLDARRWIEVEVTKDKASWFDDFDW